MPRRADAENVIRFTNAVIAGLSLKDGQSERVVWDSEVRGFGLRLRASGNRTWVIRPPRGGGKSKLHTLNSVDAMKLADARESARDKLADVRRGSDPTEARKQARAQAAVTLGSLIPTYIADREKHLRPSSIVNMKKALNGHWKPLHERPMAAITRAEIADCHRAIAVEHPHAADRARSELSTFFTWAIREGRLDLNPAMNTNKATKPTKRERVLNDEEIAAVWWACRDDDYGRIVKLLMLTGLRLKEVAEMRWEELNRPEALWTIPKARMKGKRTHEVPLSPAVLSLLDTIPDRGRDYLFGAGDGPYSGFSKAKKAMNARLGSTVAPWHIHDIRHTVDTGMNEIGILPHIVSEVLSHLGEHKRGISGTYNHAAYRAEKRDALDRWAELVQGIVATGD